MHHIAARVRDFDAAVAFYTNGLGFTPKIEWGAGEGRAAMLDIGDGTSLELFAGGAADDKPEGAVLHVALRTTNCDAALQRAVAAGAVMTMAPTDIEIPSRPAPARVRIAFCKTPSGETVEFIQSADV